MINALRAEPASPSLRATPIGQNALHHLLIRFAPLPAVQSYITTGRRREQRETPPYVNVYYPAQYAVGENPIDHFRFALRYEPLDLGILYAAFQDRIIEAQAIERWVRAEPTGSLSRRAWFLYEFLTGRQIDLEPAARNVPYTYALDPKKHYTAAPINSPRHRVRNNLLGGPGLCPTLRRTDSIRKRAEAHLSERANRLMQVYPPDVLNNAIHFLYTRETRASFAIEGERPTRTKEQRFLRALENIAVFQPNKQGLIALQNEIVDPHFAATDWRGEEVFVGERIRDHEKIHFIAARAKDVPFLMDAWQDMTDRVLNSPDLDPVLAASVASFAFVFIHPFEDGNGRIHRFLMHYLLTWKKFTLNNVIFPISAAIVRQLPAYYAALDSFSRPCLQGIEWQWEDDYTIAIRNETRDYYRFFDATLFAEFLYQMVTETIDSHLQAELDFLQTYYDAHAALNESFDLPNKELNQLTREILENEGKLSKNKRKQLFSFLSDDQVQTAEESVQKVIRNVQDRNRENRDNL